MRPARAAGGKNQPAGVAREPAVPLMPVVVETIAPIAVGIDIVGKTVRGAGVDRGVQIVAVPLAQRVGIPVQI